MDLPFHGIMAATPGTGVTRSTLKPKVGFHKGYRFAGTDNHLSQHVTIADENGLPPAHNEIDFNYDAHGSLSSEGYQPMCFLTGNVVSGDQPGFDRGSGESFSRYFRWQSGL
jgi:hypothetical protein